MSDIQYEIKSEWGKEIRRENMIFGLMLRDRERNSDTPRNKKVKEERV